MVFEVGELVTATAPAVVAICVQAESRSGWVAAVAGLAPLTPERRWRLQVRIGVAAAVLALLLMPWAPAVAAVPCLVGLICVGWRPLEEYRRTLRSLRDAPAPGAASPYRPAI